MDVKIKDFAQALRYAADEIERVNGAQNSYRSGTLDVILNLHLQLINIEGTLEEYFKQRPELIKNY